MAIRDNLAVQEFSNIDFSKLMREELGLKSFKDVETTLRQLYAWIDEMISILERHPRVSIEIHGHVLNFVNAFNSIAREIQNYNFDQDASNNFNIRKNLVTKISNWMRYVLSGYNLNNDNSFRNELNLLIIYNTLKFEDLQDISTRRNELDEIGNELVSKRREYSELLLALQQQAASKTTIDYASIFEEQSSSHSNFSLKPFKMGGAERWLFASILLIIAFIIFLHKINDALPVDFDLKSSEITVQLLTRLVVISFFIYIVTLVIRQYTVQKHLATLNRHRKNVLNSFDLFIRTIDKEDTQTRNTLMMEVAKAIYESGQTGYVTVKDGDNSSSLIEMTKYISPGKQS